MGSAGVGGEEWYRPHTCMCGGRTVEDSEVQRLSDDTFQIDTLDSV